MWALTRLLVADCRRGQSNIDTSQPYAFSVYHPHAPHCSKGWPWAKPNDPTLCSVLNVTRQTSEERFADQMVRPGLTANHFVELAV